MGNYHQKVSEPDKTGERNATFVEEYLKLSGRSISELAFSLRVDKRDLQRLLRERSCGIRLMESLYQYFGPLWREEVFPVDRASQREKELAREHAEISARRQRLEEERRTAPALVRAVRRLVPDQDRRPDV